MDKPSIHVGVVTPVWECEQWIKRSLESIQNQTYRHFRCVVVDDNSSDRSYEIARETVGDDERFIVIKNSERRFVLANTLMATQKAADSPEDVIVIVDGDDWLKHDRVFEKIAQIYTDPDVWLTYGNSELLNRPRRARLLGRQVKGTEPYPQPVLDTNLFRYHTFLASHLRTYRKFLWDKVRDEDLRDTDGEYFWAAGDAAAGFPMLEMATAKHIRYIDEVLYVYNNNHANSDNRPELRNRKLKVKLEIASRPRYSPLDPD